MMTGASEATQIARDCADDARARLRIPSYHVEHVCIYMVCTVCIYTYTYNICVQIFTDVYGSHSNTGNFPSQPSVWYYF